MAQLDPPPSPDTIRVKLSTAYLKCYNIRMAEAGEDTGSEIDFYAGVPVRFLEDHDDNEPRNGINTLNA